MKFGLYLEENRIAEWKEFYINYELLKSFLKPFQIRYKKRQADFNKKKSGNRSFFFDQRSNSLNSLSDIQIFPNQNEKALLEKFGIQIILELKKVNFFFDLKVKKCHDRIKEIKEQLEFIEKNKNIYNRYKNSIENAIKELFKEIIYIKSFVELNLKAKDKIMKKFQKFTKVLDSKENEETVKEINKKFEILISNSNLLNPLQILSIEQTEIEKIFSEFFFDKYSSNAIKILKDFASQTFFTQSQSFYFGFFLGILSILIVLCLMIMIYFHIDMDDDAKFKTIFPMFRGYLVFILYFWFLALNVYVWNLYHINYQVAFDFDNHYSDVMSICKRAAFFSILVILMLLCYMIERTEIPILYDLVSFIPLEFTPLVCWIITFCYLFSPFHNFNYLGRIYLFDLFFESMASITVRNQLRHTWFGDQLTSLTGPLRDFEYTTCYYTHYFETVEEKKRLCNNHRPIVLCVNLLPYVVRLLQCIKTIFDNKKIFPDILNCGKYTLSILVAISSYYSSTITFFGKTWLIIAVTSSCYSYCWDMKMDYGLLQKGKNYPLRNQLIYEKKYIYYTAMTLNFFGRFAWVLTISPEVVYRFIRPEFFSMIIYLIEMLRRGMWNFFRIELKHIDLCQQFQIGTKVDLPLIKIGKDNFIPKEEKGKIEMNKLNKVKDDVVQDDKSTFLLDMYSNNQHNRESNLSIPNTVKPYESFKKIKDLDLNKKLQNYINNYNKKTKNKTSGFKSISTLKKFEMKSYSNKKK